MSYGIGLAGYGGIGRLHALCWRMLPLVYPELPTVRLAVVAAASEATRARARRELGAEVAILDDALLIATHTEVQIVDCCLPTDAHVALVTRALANGRAVFCEKPLTSDLLATQQLAAQAAQMGVVASVNYHFRQVPALAEARRRVQAGLLGEVRGFHLRYHRASNLNIHRPITWRFVGDGSGVLLDLGAHLVDQVLTLLGPVARVAARTRTVVRERPGVDGTLTAVSGDDIAWLDLELADGGYGTISVSKMVPGANDDVRIEAYGARGALLYDARDPNVIEIAENGGAMQRITMLSRTPGAVLPAAETPTGAIQWHLASIAAFVASMQPDPPDRAPTFDEAARVDAVLAAAQQSVRAGGAWVDI